VTGPTATIEALLAAPLYMRPQLADGWLYYVSTRDGLMSLYRQPLAGGEPERLLPDDVALPNPKLVYGEAFVVLPSLQKIMVSLDSDGDESYRPCFIPLSGGTPELVFGDRFADSMAYFIDVDETTLRGFLHVVPKREREHSTYLADFDAREVTRIGVSVDGRYPIGRDADFARVALVDSYTSGDTVLRLWERDGGETRVLAGKPRDARAPDEEVPLSSFDHATLYDDGLLLLTTLFDDAGGLGWVPLDGGPVVPVAIEGTRHEGIGELEEVRRLDGDVHLIKHNIDGCSWGYAGTFDREARVMRLTRTLWGEGPLAGGVVESVSHDQDTGAFVLSFSTATAPAGIFVLEPATHEVTRHAGHELGALSARLSAGEDASFTSHDGLRVSARLYVPDAGVGAGPPWPVVHYIHGGPQSQERPDFTWFSMPLIQLFTLSGFAVFVPNARGSSGYGLSYKKRVDHDWGGLDRLDHVQALQTLREDPRLDLDRLGVMGRSYGGYMTLTLLGRHPAHYRAGVDMFGPYDLHAFLGALPESWKTYFELAVGHPERDRDFLVERSPRTHLHALAAPLLVIQGRNDPRVVVGESDTLVEHLRAEGKDVDYLVFDDEGHDMVRHDNRVRCYLAIVEHFTRHL
jgi:dipeptidyl aminopeptidase/acylaminoacyl peptidase